jgi:hypothetical protein
MKESYGEREAHYIGSLIEILYVCKCERAMRMEVSVRNNQPSACRCGSPLQLDVLSLNRKLLGDASAKRYCIPCMADLFECAVEDIVSKLDAFKQEGCRLFPARAPSA